MSYYEGFQMPSHHLPPAEISPNFSGLGAESATSGASALAGLALAATPLMVGYGVYKRGHGIGWSAAASVGTGIAMWPAMLVALFIPGGFLIPPLLAGLYAFKD